MSLALVDVSPLGELSLEALADRVNAEHALVAGAAASMLDHAIAAGELLIEARTRIKHGEWTDWLASNCHVSHEWANTYMRIARHQNLVRSSGHTTIKGAERFLISQNARDARFDPVIRAEAERLYAEGKTQYEIAVELGASQPTIARWLNPEMEARQRQKQAKATRAARAALRRETRQGLAKRIGGDLGEGYSLVRKALDVLERVSTSHDVPAVRLKASSAMQSLYNAEDRVNEALVAADIGR